MRHHGKVSQYSVPDCHRFRTLATATSTYRTLWAAAYRFMQNEVSIGIDRVIILLRLQFKLNNDTD